MFGNNQIVGQKFFAQDPPRTLRVTSMFYTLQGEGPMGGRPCLFIRLAMCNLACSFCFPSHYPITVKGKGSIRLDEVAVGDKIITLDDNLKPTYTTVKAVNSRWVDKDDMVRVNYDVDGVHKHLVVTKEHPFNVKGNGFIAAADLRSGMVIHHLPGTEQAAFRMADNNPMFNKTTARKVSATTKANYATGNLVPYERDAVWRDNQSQRMSVKNPMHDNDVVKKVTESKVYDKSTLEKVVHRVLKATGFPVTYVGNKKGWLLGDRETGYMRPDFHFVGTRKVLEVYDKTCPFYTDDRQTEVGERAYKEKRKRHYAKFGYSVGFLTAQNLGLRNFYKVMDTPMSVIQQKVGRFVTNGVRVVSVETLSMKSINAPYTKAGTYNDGQIKVTNFTCDGNNTFCMKGLHTHNCDTFFDSGDLLTFEEIEAKAYHVICAYWNERGIPVPRTVLKEWDPDSLRKKMLHRHFTPGGNIDVSAFEDMGDLGPYNTGLVITGGEPLLQANLEAFLARQVSRYEWVQIESNGIIERSLHDSKIILVCSPKCAERDGKPIKYLKPAEWMLNRANCLKFVMSADADSPYSEVPEWALDWKQTTGKGVYVSPMNVYNDIPHKAKVMRAQKGEITMLERSTVDEVVSFWEEGLLDMKANKINHEYAARYCLDHSLRMNLQLHLYASLA